MAKKTTGKRRTLEGEQENTIKTPLNLWIVHQQIQHVQTSRTRVAQAQGLRIFVSLKQLSSTCHVWFLAAPDTDYKHKFSLTLFLHISYLSDGLTLTNKYYESQPMYTLRWSTAGWRANTNPISHRLWAQDGWVQRHRRRSDRSRRLRAQKNWAWKEFCDWSASNPGKIMRSSLTEDMDEYGKVGADTSCLQLQMHSDCDSAESIADSDLEDGELRKKLASPLYLQSREDSESSRMPIARGNLLHCYRREEQVQSVLKLI